MTAQDSQTPEPAANTPRQSSPTPYPAFHHDSTLGEAMSVWLKNLLFRIFTLGIGHFWAVTNERRFLWQHSKLLDERMEYTGRGLELFKGFLIVAVVYLIPVLVLEFLAQDMDETLVLLLSLYVFAIAFLFPMAMFLSRRYMLARTQWRGVGFHQEGSPFGYWKVAIVQILLILVTLGLWYGKAIDKMQRYLWGHTCLGDTQLGLGNKRPSLVLLTLGMSLLLLLFMTIGISFTISLLNHLDIPNSETREMMGGLVSIVIVFTASIFTSAMINSRIYKSLCADLTLAGCRFISTHTLWQWLGASLRSWLVLLITLGTGKVFATRIWLKFWEKHLKIEGQPDYQQIERGKTADGSMGDALLDAADMGGGIGI